MKRVIDNSRQNSVAAGQKKIHRFLSRAQWLLVAVCWLLLSASPGFGQYGRPPESSMPKGGKPEVLKEVTIEQRLNEQVPLDLEFRDETGRAVRLAEYFGEKPVVLSLVYYECPMLCNQVLNGMVGTLEALSFTAGKEFTVLTVSFDARETPALAAAKKKTYLKRYGREGAADGWHFLTGSQESIDRLTAAVGFRYRWDPESNQFAHASAIMVATPAGKLSHYFYGIEYSARELRLGLVEASSNRIGSPVDQLILYCYHYDPTTGKYGPVVMNIMRLGGILTVVGLAALLLILWRRGRRSEPFGESVVGGGTA